MKSNLLAVIVITFATTLLMAQEESPHRDRVHSVRKTIDSVGRLDAKDVSVVDSFRNMFINAKTSGQLRSMYAANRVQEQNSVDNYATAFGGILKYELGSFYGFNAAAAFYTSFDIAALSGRANAHNPELSSSAKNYTDMSEAYINYKYAAFNLRAGRQLLETPLADSDDIRMIQNTFEAYIASYELFGASLLAGKIESWQGVDADLDAGWSPVGEDGAYLAGISYDDMLEGNLWYYKITGLTDALYFDLGIKYPLSDDFLLHAGMQYLHEAEIDGSGVAADIYGGLFEFVAYDVGLNLAFNKAAKKSAKESFAGTGGGSMYTSMDTMTIDVISKDREVLAYVFGLSYEINEFGFLYAHGDFIGEENAQGQKAWVREHNIGCSYELNDELLVSALYVLSSDEQSEQKSEYDFQRLQLMVHYNF